MIIAKIVKLLAFSTCLVILALCSINLARSPVVDALANVSGCENEPNAYSANLMGLPVLSDLYVRLDNQQETQSPVTIYFQSNSSQECQVIGQVTPNASNWIALGDIHLPASSGSFVVVGNGLSSGAYQPALSILMLENNSICNPLNGCKINYKGYSGSLQPLQASSATDEVAVYLLLPYQKNNGYSQVSYYADGQYVYGSARLRPFDQNYLSGGQHNVIIQVSFNNGEILSIHQGINMGTDYSGKLWLRSIAYRENDKLLVFMIPGTFTLVILSILWIVRSIYKRRLYKKMHGLEDYKPPTNSADSPSDGNHVIVG